MKGKKGVVKSSGASKSTKQAAIVAALSLITAIAFKCGEEDVSVVLGIVGSVLGCGVAYVLPGNHINTPITYDTNILTNMSY